MSKVPYAEKRLVVVLVSGVPARDGLGDGSAAPVCGAERRRDR